MKERLKEIRGITLIALVITIIVLLILAGVTIATLTGENGILTRATEADVKTRAARLREERDLWKTNIEADDYTEDKKAEELDELLGRLENEGAITEEEKNTIKETGKVTIGEETIVFVTVADKVKIGDYVDYTPDDKTESYDKFGETYSGYANGNIGQDDSLKWRVLNVNSDGTIDLISDKATSATVCFTGARGYNNGVYLLNDYCQTMYSNSSIGATARSLNIEDIQEHLRIDEETGKKVYETYTSETGATYATGTYSYENSKWYPVKWKEDEGINGESEQTEIKEYATEDEAKSQEDNILTVTQTEWALYANEVQASHFENADTRDSSKAETMYYELLSNDGEDTHYCWLASRFVDTNNSTYANYAEFGLRQVWNGGFRGFPMFTSNGNSASSRAHMSIRPVVTLSSDVIDLSTDYNTETGWNLK